MTLRDKPARKTTAFSSDDEEEEQKDKKFGESTVIRFQKKRRRRTAFNQLIQFSEQARIDRTNEKDAIMSQVLQEIKISLRRLNELANPPAEEHVDRNYLTDRLANIITYDIPKEMSKYV